MEIKGNNSERKMEIEWFKIEYVFSEKSTKKQRKDMTQNFYDNLRPEFLKLMESWWYDEEGFDRKPIWSIKGIFPAYNSIDVMNYILDNSGKTIPIIFAESYKWSFKPPTISNKDKVNIMLRHLDYLLDKE